MSHKFYLESSFHSLLAQMDNDLATQTQAKGCPYCQGCLDVANYPRSPFGLPASLRNYYAVRMSFCCRNCRKRTLPPSVRFFGRYWYVFVIHLLLNILQSGVTEKRLIELQKQLGVQVSESTLKRWRRWWRGTFIDTTFWQGKKGDLMPPPEPAAHYPGELLARFQGELSDKFVHLLKFLSPLTGGILRAV